MKQIFLLSIIFALFQIPSLAQKSNASFADSKNRKDIRITAKDKALIVKYILSEYDFLNRHLYKEEMKEVVYLSIEELSPQFVPKVLGISFVLVSPKEIEERIKNGFGYFAFQKFKVEGQKVLISFCYNYRDTGFKDRNPRTSGSPDSSYGISYEFQKVRGKWKGKVLDGYQSQS